ncbi:Bystin [Thalictrum thalictroides]|uniref:Bystin n=1 Tax=Thalictrum thalictroides TaxID=46969 RepID=A0A7J6W6P8_THATH|nr:Bystin [Thalictrum thalictroides]
MAKKRDRAQQQQHSKPFLTDESESHVSKKKKLRAPKQHQQEEKMISANMSSKVMKQALLQQKEIEDEETKDNVFSKIDDEPNEASDDSEEDIDDFGGFSETQSQYNGYDEEANEEEEKLLEAFMSKDVGPQLTLADLIINKIRERDEQVSSEARPLPKMDNAIIDLYKGVGKLLSKYTAGKVPKAFKHIPSLEVWEDVLYLTEPEKWSANAMFQATRIFASNMGVKKAQRFYRLVLLPRIREDIRKNKRLHFSLYQALKKSVYKPAAFNKGILFPLCESGTCNLREAVIVGSIIQKVSIPPNHSSVAIMKLAEMDYCGTTSYFIKLLLDKKYALPYRVLDAVVAHFMRFLDDTRIMPVIWHQSLLTFVQRYKHELTKEDKDNLHELTQYQKHYLVTNEIRRELNNSRNRGEKEDPMSINILTMPFNIVHLITVVLISVYLCYNLYGS